MVFDWHVYHRDNHWPRVDRGKPFRGRTIGRNVHHTSLLITLKLLINLKRNLSPLKTPIFDRSPNINAKKQNYSFFCGSQRSLGMHIFFGCLCLMYNFLHQWSESNATRHPSETSAALLGVTSWHPELLHCTVVVSHALEFPDVVAPKALEIPSTAVPVPQLGTEALSSLSRKIWNAAGCSQQTKRRTEIQTPEEEKCTSGHAEIYTRRVRSTQEE